MKNPIPCLTTFLVGAVCCSLFGCGSIARSHGDVAAASRSARQQVGAACAIPVNYTANAGAEAAYRIQPGDDLMLTFYLSPEFDTEVTVRPDGKIATRIGDDLQAADLTPGELSAEINRAYSKELRDPQASVVVKNSPSRVTYVQGEVTKPGAIPLMPGMTAMAAISQAGGFTEDAGTNNVILIRRDACGEPQGIRLDLAQVLDQKDNQEDALLMPADMLLVPRSGIANVDLFVKQYVRGVLPVQPYLTVTPF